MSRKMRIAVNTGSCSRLPIGQKMKPGMDCLVEYTNRCGGTYVRARILQPIPETRKVRCELVDDLPEVYPHASEVFYTNFEILSYPKFVRQKKNFDDHDRNCFPCKLMVYIFISFL